MEKEIIEKLGLIATNKTHGMSFLTQLIFYKYGEYYCIAGNIDGTLRNDNIITFFNYNNGKSVLVTKGFLTDCELKVIELTLTDALKD
jgi:hypothetical protein